MSCSGARWRVRPVGQAGGSAARGVGDEGPDGVPHFYGRWTRRILGGHAGRISEDGRGMDDRSVPLIEEPVTEDEPEGGEAVFPADFFAFGVIASGIIDAGFVEAIVAARELGGQFGFDAETLGCQLHALDAL